MLQELLDPYRGREDIKLDELVSLAAEIIPRVTGPQLRWRVSEIPDVRTVRYYIQQGLVDRPLGSEGPAALYGFRHLLQLVAIKVLQGHFLPIRAIKEALGSVETGDLERRLGDWLARPRPDLSSPEYWEKWVPLQSRAEDESIPARKSPARLRGWREALRGEKPYSPGSAHDYLESLAGKKRRGIRLGERAASYDDPLEDASLAMTVHESPGRTIVVEPPASPVDRSDEAGSEEPDASWQRIELHPGIELHVREGARIPAEPSFLSALASRLRVILERMGRKKKEDDE